MNAPGARVALLACGAVAIDTKTLVERHGWNADVHGISSDLHMTPLEIAPAYHWKQCTPAGRTAGYRESTSSSRPPVPQSP